jgi:hypothetical protein
MAFTDALLTLSTYPDRMPQSRLRETVRLAKVVAPHIFGIAITENFIGTSFSAFGDLILGIPAIAADQTKKSYENTQLGLAAFEQLAAEENVAAKAIQESCNSAELKSRLLRHARMHDVTIVPLMPAPDQFCQCDPEAMLFESGRPVIVVPPDFKCSKPSGIGVVAVAWDFGGPAARAISDALPILRTGQNRHDRKRKAH